MSDISAIIRTLEVNGQAVSSYKSFEVIPTAKARQVELMADTEVTEMTQRWTIVVGYVDELNDFAWKGLNNARITITLLNGQVEDHYGVTYLSQTGVKRDGENDPDTEITLHFKGPPKKTVG